MVMVLPVLPVLLEPVWASFPQPIHHVGAGFPRPDRLDPARTRPGRRPPSPPKEI